ncbi:MAG: 23S rRNA (adenine(2030)-N(6))-methyltransferase RlmJ [Hydrogenophaga sp.]|jgi:23S rRNA (adenine2030-N6)-methyltransferase|uniref:23S rRNA (adenine(2030)-N(6))-methyltransferase RlmJ n=1 Tax=Hydrogenophaga sp. TaxID=1904254 RepID=UPI0027273CD9|nr:23S rRNA (adenine(2030)-N(6))-methyltransferase RlmJ [Hydrogenophaga sp.]MDO9571368.1 23S rRNA (adenine(2030)-N(6))-methyltransferase RlmJ [Hydrogenophaga sp.]MDP1893899.1 23S rRNA (adenine(2030)-N(6))-methyltransferase RlmJ [Hydrogenophaga sp.]MDP2094189.1 23S rRNA (adenine(2030)-N(6))-methyltransferase RlmJ [Hydrogenophaga sp.]MDP3342969.1 23S rRNA (adenine(2030)-N(6))-methyltransferase RlmJ [Hydrogenophaga sp.]MDP3808257.1 23S rRNA (adenine(2030)-N(6))-methyltransferase RlmJ [Hydrogenoph
MFSYRHAFHAGNHADVLKHTTLIATLRHLMQKEAGITLIDTHAGAGLYRLDGDYTETGGEAKDGVVKLFAALRPAGKPAVAPVAPALAEYMDLIASFNPSGALRVYPGSPFVMHHLLRAESRDRLKLFELHPTDSKVLAANIAQLEAGRQIAVAREDGFEGIKAFLPPPPSATGSKRAALLMDPSYEVKTDYGRVSACIQEQLKRFPTGTYMVWYPIIPRPEAHDLPRRLKTLANQSKRPWLNATLAIGQDPTHGPEDRPGLTASGMFVINPPHTLKAVLQAALPQMLAVLGRGRGQGQTVDSGA